MAVHDCYSIQSAPVQPLNYQHIVDQTRGEILRPPGGSVSQTIVFGYEEIRDILLTKHRKKVMLLSKYSLERNNTIPSIFRTHTVRNRKRDCHL
jgi:hypothetical protein